MDIVRRNRGRGGRRTRTTVGVNGLGNRRQITRTPLELRAMSSQLTNGSNDPIPVYDTIKLKHRIQILGTLPATTPFQQDITTGTINANIPGGTTSWDKFRIVKIDVWGSDTQGISLAFPPTTATPDVESDGATFSDWGVPGSRRCALHVVPAFSYRSRWQYLATASPVVMFSLIGSGPAPTVGQFYILNITLELQTVTQALPNLRFAQLSISNDEDSAAGP
jgi:hypothetical protein